MLLELYMEETIRRLILLSESGLECVRASLHLMMMHQWHLSNLQARRSRAILHLLMISKLF
jgi:hypothetical protein